jgi:tRNA-dihydrouridine synthase A
MTCAKDRTLQPSMCRDMAQARTDGLALPVSAARALQMGRAPSEATRMLSRPSHRFCVAPMMHWTDRHCRTFHRLLSRRARLYTEMITDQAILHGDRKALLGFGPHERPLALQLGGAMPASLAEAAAIAADYGYDEINLNVGCPSERVQEGRFGACLMAEPRLVARAIAAISARVSLPVTVKCRIGIDEQDSEADLQRFVETVADAGCRTFIVHARKAWLKGLSPKENRTLPPLDYDRVYRLKRAHPEFAIVINGGIASLAAAEVHLEHVDGVALGRAAYQNPYLLADVDRRLFGERGAAPTRGAVLEALMPYIASELSAGVRLSGMLRHILGLYAGQPGGRAFRRLLSERAPRRDAGAEVVLAALEAVDAAAAGRGAQGGLPDAAAPIATAAPLG